MKLNRFEVLIGAMFFIFVIISIIAIVTIYSDKNKCIANPLVYGVSEYEKLNKESITCVCSFSDPFKLPFFVNSSQVYQNSYTISNYPRLS